VNRIATLGDAVLKGNRAIVGLFQYLVDLAIEPARLGFWLVCGRHA